jgi:hypothetical protein
MMMNVRSAVLDDQTRADRHTASGKYPDGKPMAELLREHFVVILLVLFAGVLYWGFQPRKRKRNQGLAGKVSSDTGDNA